jgi:hypothetical protein
VREHAHAAQGQRERGGGNHRRQPPPQLLDLIRGHRAQEAQGHVQLLAAGPAAPGERAQQRIQQQACFLGEVDGDEQARHRAGT